jgi:hypothetical protein
MQQEQFLMAKKQLERTDKLNDRAEAIQKKV